MLAVTLASIGKHFQKYLNQYDVKGRKKEKIEIVYSDKEHIFSELKKGTLSWKTPLFSYFCSSFEDTNIIRPSASKANIDDNLSSAYEVSLIEKTLNIEVIYVCSSIDDGYFEFMSLYNFTQWNSYLKVDVKRDYVNLSFNTAFYDHSPLTTPSMGREGRDYDRGKYYVLEGNFKVDSYISFVDKKPLIRKTSFFGNEWENINFYSKENDYGG